MLDEYKCPLVGSSDKTDFRITFSATVLTIQNFSEIWESHNHQVHPDEVFKCSFIMVFGYDLQKDIPMIRFVSLIYLERTINKALSNSKEMIIHFVKNGHKSKAWYSFVTICLTFNLLWSKLLPLKCFPSLWAL